MEFVQARDGTSIAYRRSGAGPALVLLHGTSASHVRWAPVLPALERYFTCYALDRRGRGGSGDAQPYAIEREYEDLLALLEILDAPAYVLGHSYGALVALEAALQSQQVDKLIVYEPPLALPPGSPFFPMQVIEQLQAALAIGDREAVLSIFLRQVVGMSEQELALMRSLPAWAARLSAAPTLARELQAVNAYHFDAERFSQLHTPTLLMVGAESPATFQAPIAALATALPNSHVLALPGQKHIAMDQAPELFVREVVAFVSGAPATALE